MGRHMGLTGRVRETVREGRDTDRRSGNLWAVNRPGRIANRSTQSHGNMAFVCARIMDRSMTLVDIITVDNVEYDVRAGPGRAIKGKVTNVLRWYSDTDVGRVRNLTGALT